MQYKEWALVFNVQDVVTLVPPGISNFVLIFALITFPVPSSLLDIYSHYLFRTMDCI
jgi:hypothetical protein